MKHKCFLQFILIDQLINKHLDKPHLDIFFSINRYQSIASTETYLEPIRTSRMELFCENSRGLLTFNYFHKNTSL